MKKLMIAALLALGMAGASQASVYNWGITKDGSLNDYADDKIYIVLASDWTAESTLETIQAKALNGAGNALVTKMKKTGVDDTFFKYGSTDVSGETLDTVFVMVDGDGKQINWEQTLTSTASTSSEKTFIRPPAATVAALASKGFNNFPGSGDVPEPTSALLMLLGVAGLALRRRVA